MPTPSVKPEWFASPEANPSGEAGLRFSCTLCGNCCSGPPGYILVTPEEIAALARRMGVTEAVFTSQYTHMTSEGRSLNEKDGPKGLDCVFLDREKIPGKAVCGLYEDRPIQCRTWPFWPSVIRSKSSWQAAKRTCPGMDNGKLYTVQQIRIQRDTFDI